MNAHVRTVGASATTAPAGSTAGAGTTQRFLLLIVVFVTGSAYMLTHLFSSFTDPRSLLFGCQLAAGVNPNVDSTANYLARQTTAYGRCVDKYVGGWGYVWLPHIVTALLLSLAILLYLFLPYWKARASRVVPLERVDPTGSLRAALIELAGRSGLSRHPSFAVDMASRSANALVFGRLGRYTVKIDAPLVAAFGRDRAAFEATLLHEFAHIRNKDVDLTYLTVAIWRTFLFGVLLPFALWEGWQVVSGALSRAQPLYWSGEAPGHVRNLMLSTFIVALVYLARADILQVRELYADIAAVRHKADPRLWARHHSAVPCAYGRPGAMSVIRSAVRTHPDWGMRVAALTDPSALFTVRARSMFLTGAAAGILGYFLSDTPATGIYLARYSWLEGATIWPPAVLVTIVAGLAVMRDVTYSVKNDLPVPSGLRAGFWLGMGQLGGELLASQSLSNEWILAFPQVLLLLLLVIVPTAVMWWTAECAALWAAAATRRRRLIADVGTLMAAALTLAWWYDWWQQIGTGYASGNVLGTAQVHALFYPTYSHSTTMDVIAGLTTPIVTLNERWNLLLTAVLWLIPMIGLAGRTRRRISPPEGADRRRRWTSWRTLSAGSAFGLAGGVAAAIGVPVIAARAHLWMHSGIQSPQEVIFVYASWVFGLLLVTATGAALAASAATRGQVTSAMSAAASALAIGLVMFFAVNQTDGCVPALNRVQPTCAFATEADWAVLTLVLPYLLSAAGIFSLIGASLVAVFIRLWNPIDIPENLTDGIEARPGRSAGRMTWTVVVGATIVVACAVSYADQASNNAASQSEDLLASAVTTQTAPTPIRVEQIRAWSYLGGRQLIQQYAEKVDAIVQAGRGGYVNGPAMRRACIDIGSTVMRAQRYFPPPGSQRSAWSNVLADTATGARKCVRGLDQRNKQLFLSGLRDLTEASGAMNRVASRLVEESAR